MGLTDSIKGLFGGVNFGGVVNSVTIMIFVVIIVVLLLVIAFIFINSRRYKYRVTVFENLAGQGYVPTIRDKAKMISVGDGGEEILFLKKSKLYRQAYGKKIGKNHYAFVVGNDGYWYNTTFGDFDSKRQELGLEPIDRDMRYMNVAIRRNIKNRFEQTTFLQKYGGLIAYIALIAITGVMMWLLFDKYLDIANSVKLAIDASKEVLDKAGSVLASVDNINTQSGIRGV